MEEAASSRLVLNCYTKKTSRPEGRKPVVFCH